ncbi:hypothetical protein PISMIDRAFT_670491 [Pisolithus microcarpus 441]|uniref:Unplaced genomic scaffold scaffold_2, whole genome shotgun sequence n=1 Tax=Pisolithus microcarpus 441 TaxID=765257 RepID=A0A0C9YZ70_9AGAM|nr:hypothetical protein PISMIDRAFT_670491 [Pisolithus microcarpus 441]
MIEANNLTLHMYTVYFAGCYQIRAGILEGMLRETSTWRTRQWAVFPRWKSLS